MNSGFPSAPIPSLLKRLISSTAFAVVSTVVLSQLWCLQAIGASLQRVALASNENDVMRVYFAPFDAPFLKNEYSLRINSILSSLNQFGERSFLSDPPIDAYKRRLLDASISDYALTPRGKELLDENRKWLLDKGGRPTPGYLKYSDAHEKLSSVLQLNNLNEAKEQLLHFFADVQAFRYVNAQQIVKSLASNPLRRAFQAISDRSVVGVVMGNEYSFLPRPDDLDLAENWQSIALTAKEKSESIRGLATYVNVYVGVADRVLEGLVEPKADQPFFLPKRLLFVKSLQLSASGPIPTDEDLLRVEVPQEKFDIYRSSSAGSQVIFLLAVEMERCAF
jgi:hypothetical protein